MEPVIRSLHNCMMLDFHDIKHLKYEMRRGGEDISHVSGPWQPWPITFITQMMAKGQMTLF